MSTFKTFAELNGKLLRKNDRVIFEHEEYKIVAIVYTIGLGDEKGYSIDNKIFRLLGLDPWEFCKQHYVKLPGDWEWYKTKYPNLWPPYCCDESITKVVLELFRMIEEQKQLKETSTTLFID